MHNRQDHPPQIGPWEIGNLIKEISIEYDLQVTLDIQFHPVYYWRFLWSKNIYQTITPALNNYKKRDLPWSVIRTSRISHFDLDSYDELKSRALSLQEVYDYISKQRNGLRHDTSMLPNVIYSS